LKINIKIKIKIKIKTIKRHNKNGRKNEILWMKASSAKISY
jgi:hypothetical protein